MIDPFTAVAAATTAFKTVQKFVAAGQDIENTIGQMGKWYTAVSDFRKGSQLAKKPPLFKKLFNAGSVEEEALALLMHEKKIMEQEKELRTILNFRYGPATWDELTDMRRKIRARREKDVYRQAELRKEFLDLIALCLIGILILGALGVLFYLVGKSRGNW